MSFFDRPLVAIIVICFVFEPGVAYLPTELHYIIGFLAGTLAQVVPNIIRSRDESR